MTWRQFGMALQLVSELNVGTRVRAAELAEREAFKRSKAALGAV